MKKVYIRTFGCQMNFRDSELITGMLLSKGWEIADDPDAADVVLFNTCSVRQHAEDRVIGNLQRLSFRKKKEPGLKIGVLGCMAERHGELLMKEFPQVDVVVGPNHIFSVPELLEKACGGEKIVAVGRTTHPLKGPVPGYRAGTFFSSVNIVYGCDNFCSYCVVPYVRGREVSRPKKYIIDEIKELAGRGFKEVTLLGQNVNSYGKGITGLNFPKLLGAVNGIKGIERIRFVTSHPKDAGSELFKAMRDLEKVCEHFHLPLQSGSEKILDLMNRRYTVKGYSEKIGLLRKLVPGVGITTDIIVGFPSEREADYRATRKALEEVGFNAAFIFKYSPRSPALSSCLVDDVPGEVKKERNNELLDLQKRISSDRNREYKDSIQEVLVEGKSRMSDKDLIGRTRSNVSCVFPGDAGLIGTMVKVRVDSTSPFTLKGERV